MTSPNNKRKDAANRRLEGVLIRSHLIEKNESSTGRREGFKAACLFTDGRIRSTDA
jgi:hypothetical protein